MMQSEAFLVLTLVLVAMESSLGRKEVYHLSIYSTLTHG
jgi:hypothetical protein